MKKIVFGLFIISVFVASFALYAGLTHNPMDVFCIKRDSCEFNFQYAAFIWFSWFIPVFIFPLIVIFVFKYLIFFITKNSSGR